MGGDEIMDWMNQISGLINSIVTQIQESQKLDATIQSQQASLMEKINALDSQLNYLTNAKATYQQAINQISSQLSEEELKSQVDYTKIAIYFAVGLVAGIVVKKFVK
ncbi:MAG TPA: hypothetical protein PK390_04095 [Fervidobacterium nodosum]|nr:hypothetical protein [Fervidobacterium nodosum]